MKKLIIILPLIFLLVACDTQTNQEKKDDITENQIFNESLYINGNKEEIEVLENKEKINIEYKDRLYILTKAQYEKLKQKDNNLLLTYDNKVVENFDEGDIEKYKKFSEFYQVLMKNGETLQLFDKPNVDFEAEKSDIAENIVGVFKHGDHYHVQLKDGTEYISYEDPTVLNPELKVEEYHGNHENENIEKPSNTEKDSFTEKNKDSEESDDTSSESEKLTFIPVVKLEELKDVNIISADLHEDHWHLKDDKGNEYLTYDDPRGILQNIDFGEYKGSDN